MEKDSNTKHHFNKATKEKKTQILSDLGKGETPLYLWAKGQTQKDLEEFTVDKFDEDNNVLYLKKNKNFLAKLLGTKLVNKEVFIKYQHDQYHYFTTATFRKAEEADTYTATVKGDVYISQQRSNYRLNANRHIVVQIKIDKNVYSGNDISAGGTSIDVNKHSGKFFKKDMELQDCQLKLVGKVFQIPIMKVASIWPIKNALGEETDMMGIGLSFHGLDPVTEERLFIQINAEARAEEIRKQIENRNK